MKKPLLVLCLLAVAFGGAVAEEPHVKGVVADVREAVRLLKQARPDAVPMAFWDFDGTIIKGDLSEGFVEDGVARYKGLIEETIRAGFSPVYKGEAGWRTYRDRDYPRMMEIGRWLAWPYNAQIYADVRAADLDAFCAAKCEAVYKKWYFASSWAIWRALAEAGVENYVVSASPEAFVRNAAASLAVPMERCTGIRVEIDGGRYTTKTIYPLPMGEGKVETVRRLVLARPGGVAVAAFGNSYSTDGAFLRYVVTQRLPGGAKPVAMMINGGKERPGFEGLFRLVRQDATCGDDPESKRQ